MNFEVIILGSNSAIPTANKNPSGQLIVVNHHYYLIDCGEGTQIQLRKFGLKFQRIEAIFLSHLHGDHFFGLIGLLTTMQLLGREKPLTIYSHKGIQEIIELQLKISGGKILYPINFVDLHRNQTGLIHKDSSIEVTTFPLDHRISCNGFLIKEIKKPRNINKDKIEDFNVSLQYYQDLKEGKDVLDREGELVKNEWVTDDPPRQKAYAYCSDTAYSESIVQHIENADLLYHEATFADDHAMRATETKHSTAKQAACIALKAKVKKLIIGHFSVRYRDHSVLLNEAQTIFENTEVAKEGQHFVVG